MRKLRPFFFQSPQRSRLLNKGCRKLNHWISGTTVECVCWILTGNVRGYEHPGEHGALREAQQQKHHRAVGQTDGHPGQTGQTDGEEECSPTTQPESTHAVTHNQMKMIYNKSVYVRYFGVPYKTGLLLTSRTMYRWRCIPESILSWSRYAAEGFSSSHCKPGPTAKEDKDVLTHSQTKTKLITNFWPLKQRESTAARLGFKKRQIVVQHFMSCKRSP